MADKGRLTANQRRILVLLREHEGAAMFVGLTREFHAHVSTYGLVIWANKDPEDFLERRQLIERFETSQPGRWYRLTEDGWRRARRLAPA